jgi:hypothetical protein
MFYLNLPAETKIGDTVPVKINGDPAHVTWRDKKTLVILPNDVRPIFHTALDGKLRVRATQKESLSVAPTVLSS